MTKKQSMTKRIREILDDFPFGATPYAIALELGCEWGGERKKVYSEIARMGREGRLQKKGRGRGVLYSLPTSSKVVMTESDPEIIACREAASMLRHDIAVKLNNLADWATGGRGG